MLTGYGRVGESKRGMEWAWEDIKYGWKGWSGCRNVEVGVGGAAVGVKGGVVVRGARVVWYARNGCERCLSGRVSARMGVHVLEWACEC